MTYDKDPPRLRLSGDPSDPFVRALEDARGELPGAEQLAAIAERLPLFEAPPASFVSMARARLRAKSMQAAAIALAAAVGVSAAVVIRSALPMKAPPAATPPPAPPEVVAPAPVKSIRTAPRAAVQEEPAAPEPSEVPAAPVARPHVTAAVQSAPRSDPRPSQGDFPASDVDGPATPETEIALLGRAHQALAGNPARALALTAQHRRDYPSGVLGQESDLIAIEALEALGRKSEARASAASFRARYPSSAHLRQLDRLLGPAEGTGTSPLGR